MISKEKIRLMTDLAIYEKKYEQDVFKITKYYKSDYIFWHVLLSFLRYTAVFVIFMGAYMLFRADVFFYNVNIEGYYVIFIKTLTYYAIGAVIYCITAACVYSKRYQRARKGMLFYVTKLKRLARRFRYDLEDEY